MSSAEQRDTQLNSSSSDYVVSAAKGVLGAVPFVGSLLSEIAGTIIPNQRVDRIVKFAHELDERISEIEKNKILANLNNEEFTDLLEETLRQSARSTSDNRRAYLAEIIVNGIKSEDITFAESKELTKLLGELSDIEIIWLRFYQNANIGGDEEFRNANKHILERVTPLINGPREVVDKASIQNRYRKHLIDLGLVVPHISKGRDGKPEFDAFTGDFKINYHQISPLGDLLLRWIGISARP